MRMVWIYDLSNGLFITDNEENMEKLWRTSADSTTIFKAKVSNWILSLPPQETFYVSKIKKIREKQSVKSETMNKSYFNLNNVTSVTCTFFSYGSFEICIFLKSKNI